MLRAEPPAENCHHLLKFVYYHLKLEGRTLHWLAEESGVAYTTIVRSLRGKNTIGLSNLEALLNTIGYTIKATPYWLRKKK